MNIAQASIVKAHTAEEDCINHRLTRFDILTVSHSTRKILLDEFNRSDRQFLGYIISTRCYQGFDSVGKSIPTCCCCERLRFWYHKFWIIDRDKGKAVLIYHYHLDLAFFVSNHIVDGDFCWSSCSCIDRNYWQSFFSRLVEAFVILWFATICSDDRDTTSRILRRASPKTDNEVTTMLFQSSNSICDVLASRIWLHIAKNHIFNPFSI